ncbi:DUF1294 domain-containing protein [Psychrobacter lutiphocae]|uniref:DUF1294 domain-containing protein n=1 Tax=Psychrobacter lutiphocae TaxID=540500 RepID=UPI00037E9181|nr:DUF1294 domain-containing protein [Psychrobacter lutiphocae]
MTKRNKSRQHPSKKIRRQKSLQHQQKQQGLIAIGLYLVLVILMFSGSISPLVAGWYLALGILTYAIYAKDKKAAEQGRWRTPEMTLHLLSVLGGWAGAMLAQSRLRHKTQKPEFRMTYYLTVIINLAGLFYLISGGDFSQL